MTEEAVREVFLKHYSGGSLNEALREASEEVALAILAKHAGPGKTLPDIVKTIVGGRSRIGFFMAMFAKGDAFPVAPMRYVFHFDHVRKAMLDAVNYAHDNYEAMQPVFREWFPKEDLKMMSGDMSEAIEKPSGLPANVRGIRFDELNKEEEFFSSVLVGILGVERFQRYASEFNEALKVIRRCQAECKSLAEMVDEKES